MHCMGNSALILAAAASILGAATPFKKRLHRLFARIALGSVTFAFLILLVAFIRVDTRLVYVAEHTAMSAPLWLRIGALWSGAQGSLLLWSWFALLLAVIGLQLSAKDNGSAVRVLQVLGALLSVACVFMGTFDVNEVAPLDGAGLNVALQNPWLVLHPPLVFLAYCGFAWLYGLSLGTLRDERRQLRRALWTSAFSWLALGTAIWMGMQWAQQAPGWGTAWSWDAIETASLAAWLMALAAICWVIGALFGCVRSELAWRLIGMVFPTALICTFAARGGQLVSAHAYGGAGSGWLLLVFALLLVSVPIIKRRHVQRGTREGSAFYVGVLLVGMAVATALGALMPLLSLPGVASRVAPSSYYLQVLTPLATMVGAIGIYDLIHQMKQGEMRKQVIPWVFRTVAATGICLAVWESLWAAGLALFVCWILALWVYLTKRSTL